MRSIWPGEPEMNEGSAARAEPSSEQSPGKPVSRAYWELIRPISRASKAFLFVEIVRTYVRVRWLFWRGDLTTVVSKLRAVPPRPRARADDELADKYTGYRLGRAVRRSLGLLPGDSRCLVQSLVLTELLARRGIPSSLVIGVSSEAEFGAHAWVESDGIPLLSPEDATSRRLIEI
jgi:hypothetical protein